MNKNVLQNWSFYNRPFDTSDHVVQNLACWRASSLLFLHRDIKTKRPEPVKLDLPSDRTWARFEGHLTTLTHPWVGSNYFVLGWGIWICFKENAKIPTQSPILEPNIEKCIKNIRLFSLTCTVLCITLTGRCSLETFHWTVAHPWQQK